jgi:hypothetical protein
MLFKDKEGTKTSMTSPQTNTHPVSRLGGASLLIAIACILGCFAASSASAAPVWGISLTHQNAYGAAGTVDPSSGSATAMARESGSNPYKIVVTNKGTVNGGAVATCNVGVWTNNPSAFTYQWLRNGAVIAGATSQTYTVVGEDANKTLQCVIRGANGASASAAASNAVAISPAELTAMPSNSVAPSIVGTPAQNVTSTCSEGTWSGASTFTYQWFKNGTAIPGATASTYAVLPADNLSGLQCEVIATNGAGSVALISASKNVGVPSPAVPTGTASLSVPNAAGGIVVGSQFACSATSTVANIPNTITYQWLRSGAPIAGATSASYVIVAADAGQLIQCQATATTIEGAGSAVTTPAQIAPVPNSAPPSAATPTITGTLNVGQVITCAPGNWSGNPSFAYQWLRNGAQIVGATASTYVVQAADKGTGVQCQVTGTNAAGTIAAISANRVIVAALPSTAVLPTITPSATPAADTTVLTCNPGGSWTGSPAFTYQWLRSGSAIAGATSNTYTISEASDKEKAIQCQVIATNSEGAGTAITASVVGVSNPAPLLPGLTAAAGTVAGSRNVGSTMTCQHGNWNSTPTSFSYQWLRNGVPIAGASSGPTPTTQESFPYTVTTADLSKSIQCQVTASNASGSAVSISASGVNTVIPAAPPSAVVTMSGAPSVTVASNLPAGLLFASTIPTPSGTGWSCTIALGAGGFTCSRADTLGVGSSYPPITALVHVAPGAPDSVTTSVTVFGGGASSGATASDVTAIAPIIPFGVQTFTTEVSDAAGNPYTQAGGHPFSATANIILNTISTDNATLVAAGGDAKTMVTDLPAGFIGNPQSFPQCPLPLLGGGAFGGSNCPANTAVGIAYVSTLPVPIGAAGVTPMVANGLTVYNLDPPPGHPAEFAFNYLNASIILDGRVRSDGDFGLTVGDEVAATPLSAVKLTFCGFGAANASSFGAATGCAAATPDATPFLTNTTRCSGPPPVTTLRVDTYQKQGSFAEVDSYIGAPSAPGAAQGQHTTTSPTVLSTPTGCDKLSNDWTGANEPSITLQPDNTKADSPAGVDVDLHVPQVTKVPAGVNVGQKVNCVNAVWTNNPTATGYRWLKNGVAIPGETGPSYTLAAGDAGSAIQCEAAVTNAGGGAAAAAAPVLVAPTASVPVPPAAGIVAPTGTASPPNTLTCAPGSWTGSPAFTYRWLKNGSPIAGATASTYSVQAGDVPSNLQCVVIGTNAAGGVAAISANKLTATAPTPTPPVISAAAQVSIESELATAHMKRAIVKLPVGVSISPSAANGLQACTAAQVGVISDSPIRFNLAEAKCPTTAKVGTVTLETPLLKKTLEGSVYVAAQDENPFHSKFAMYLVVEDRSQGLTLKLAGKINPDPQTGQLTSVFENNPQLPFTDFKLHFFGGARAALANPVICGDVATTTQLSPWSAVDLDNPADSEVAHPSDGFKIDSGPNGSACANTPAERPLAPGFNAGTISTKAGAKAPFRMNLIRPDGQQELSSLSLTTPPGFSASLKGIPYCSAAAIAAAEHSSGKAEQAGSSCPANSQVGSVTATAGPGDASISVGGKAYLAGPYKGAPLSMVFVTPAVAGPFDLGTVVVRNGIYVNPETAQITVKSDPIPQIIEGVPLRIRSIAVNIDRSNFAVNPTNCEPMTVAATINGASGASANVSSRFQVGDCEALDFKPKLSMQFTGPTNRNAYPKLKAVLAPREGDANIGRAVVTLPKTEFLEQAHIRTVCTRVQFAAKACPAGSVYGYARAWSPLLDQPLQGPVYLRSSDHQLPDLVASLDGQIHIDVVGRIDSVHARIRNTFEMVPDAAVNKFELTMQGGKKGLLVNNTELCNTKPRVRAQFTGQNGKTHEASPVVKTDCGKKKSKKK